VDILVGRPYGGTAILYNRALANSIEHVYSCNSRITAILMATHSGKILLINVYMPTNYGDDESLVSYIDCLCNLQALIFEQDIVHVVITGDFNCDIGSRFYSEFNAFVSDNKLIVSDQCRLDDVFTYISDDGSKRSWIDHILSSPSIDPLIEGVNILYDVIASDHRPLIFQLRCETSRVCLLPVHNDASINVKISQWYLCDHSTLQQYNYTLDYLLVNIKGFDRISANDSYESVKMKIDSFYCDIVTCIQRAIDTCIPHRTSKTSIIIFLDGIRMCVRSMMQPEKHFFYG